MNIPNINIKVFIGLSIALVLIFFITLFITLGSKNQIPDGSGNAPTPTKVDTSGNKTLLTTITPADFTGAIEEPIPTELIDLITQKQNLKKQLPLNLSTFTIDFDYSEDKFTVALNTPKDQSLKEFQNWRQTNYPAISLNQFILN